MQTMRLKIDLRVNRNNRLNIFRALQTKNRVFVKLRKIYLKREHCMKLCAKMIAIHFLFIKDNYWELDLQGSLKISLISINLSVNLFNSMLKIILLILIFKNINYLKIQQRKKLKLKNIKMIINKMNWFSGKN